MTGDDIQTQVVLNCSVMHCLLHLLTSPKESIRKEACWTISNITAGNRQQIQVYTSSLYLRMVIPIKVFFFFLLFKAVIDANIFPVLIDILGKAEFKTRKEAAWAITNATSGGTAEQIRFLVNLVFLSDFYITFFAQTLHNNRYFRAVSIHCANYLP